MTEIIDYEVDKFEEIELEDADYGVGLSENFCIWFKEGDKQVSLNMTYDTILDLLAKLKKYEAKDDY